MARQTSRRAARRGGILPRPAALIFAALLSMLQFAGCVGIGDESVEDDIAAIRRMTFETMHDRIGKLDEDRVFYCRKEYWQWSSDPDYVRSFCRELCIERYEEVKAYEDPPDDRQFGDKLIDLLRKCTKDDAVSFGAISNRIASTAGLAWFNKDGSSLAGIAAITADDVYFIYTEMSLFEGPGQPFGVLDVFEDPPYYLWRNPYWMLVRWLTEYRDFANVVTAYRMDISPEEFKKGRLRIVEPIESDIANLRGLVFETIGDRIGKLGGDCAFYCRVLDDSPAWANKDVGYYPRLGEVKPDEDVTDDGLLGEEIIGSLRRCTMDDAVSLGSIRNRAIRTAGLAWFGKDGPLFAGVAVVTSDGVYFIFTIMEQVTDKDVTVRRYFQAAPPYYAWRDPDIGQNRWGLMDRKRGRSCWKSIYSKLEKMYPGDASSQKVFLSENSITAFRMDISPEKFQTVEKSGTVPQTGAPLVGKEI